VRICSSLSPPRLYYEKEGRKEGGRRKEGRKFSVTCAVCCCELFCVRIDFFFLLPNELTPCVLHLNVSLSGVGRGNSVKKVINWVGFRRPTLLLRFAGCAFGLPFHPQFSHVTAKRGGRATLVYKEARRREERKKNGGLQDYVEDGGVETRKLDENGVY